MIKAIIFDGYGTLFDEGKESIPKIAEKIAKRLKLNISDKQLFQEWKKEYLLREKGVFSGRTKFKTIKQINIESLSSVFNKFKIRGNPIEFVDELFYLWSHPRLFSEVKRTLVELNDYTIGILSNTDNETLFSAIAHTNLKLDYILTSENAHIYKPNIEIFLKVCRDLKLGRESILYVGNSRVDLVGSKNSGIRFVWVNRKNKRFKRLPYEPNYEIRSLDSLPDILAQC